MNGDFLSPIDGRYERYTADLRPYLSEKAFFRYRIFIEIAYLRALIELPLPPLKNFPASLLTSLYEIYENFGETDFQYLRAIEARTRHDVKAIEYFLREKWGAVLPEEHKYVLAFIHFGLTSQDVNTPAQALMWRDALQKVYLPASEELLRKLHALAYAYREVPMLGFTHGQPASPTTFGKELYVFVARGRAEIERLLSIPFWTKMGGAVGNLNAHHLAFPDIDWPQFFDDFAQKLGLRRFPYTTQILPYERWVEGWDSLRRFQSIWIDLAQDLWLYAHRGYIYLQRQTGQIGSSTMPHKSNPILFELAEGNLRLSNSLWQLFAEKLPISRLQRDLTDSTLLRNVGVALAHGLIGLRAIREGLDHIIVNETTMKSDLDAHPEVSAEAIQTLRRKEGDLFAYEKTLEEVNSGQWRFAVSPASYLGYAPSSVPPPEN